jgi:uncharacterized membrane protein YcaP (DUF421 family)
MAGFDAPQWAEVFVPDSSLAESFLRGTVIYFAVLILFRVVLKRQSGGLGMADVLLIVLVSECVSQALTADSKSVPNALAAVGALLFWTYALDRLERHWPWLQRLLEPQPVKLIADGAFLHENMAKEGVTEEELLAQVRQNGLDDPKRVKSAYIESDGTVSVIPAEEGTDGAAPTELSPTPETPADLAGAVARFEESARELEAAVAEHRKAAQAVRRTLAGHSKRPKRRKRPKSDGR